MVALVIGAVVVVMASKIAAFVIRQNISSEQQNDLSLRTRVVSEQLRDDIRLAGVGSTGAIGIDPGSAGLGALALPPTPGGGFVAISAVMGANNLGGQALASGNVQAGSDALQLVVPNPNTTARTTQRSRQGSNALFVPDASIFNNCPLVYVQDHTNPTGGGRTQLAWANLMAATQITLDDTLMFTVAPGSDVMCARVSTYWVDDRGWLHRSDLTRAAPTRLGASFVFVNTSGAVPDLLAPGIMDFQVAYKVSSEAYRQANPPRVVPGLVGERWAFTGLTPNATALFTPINTHLWFEVRVVRAHMFARRLKRVSSVAQRHTLPGAEDGPRVTVAMASGGEWMTTAEAVTNLRIFDLFASEQVPAEPY